MPISRPYFQSSANGIENGTGQQQKHRGARVSSPYAQPVEASTHISTSKWQTRIEEIGIHGTDEEQGCAEQEVEIAPGCPLEPWRAIHCESQNKWHLGTAL